MKLPQMFENALEIETAGLCIDSRYAKTNDIYFCMEGIAHDEHEFVNDVIEKGIKCTMHSKPVDDMEKRVAYIQVRSVNRTLNWMVSMFYEHLGRKMKVLDVTGTNGKSTITSIIRDVHSHFAPCGYIGTTSISYGGVALPPSLTTLDAVLVHKTMRDMVEYGMQAAALEVSSHGLGLGRVQNVDLGVAVFSNLTYDHLDFHGTIEYYSEAKKKLFTNPEKEGVAVLNTDDAYVDQLVDATETSVVAYGINNHATYQAENIRVEETESRFTLVHRTGHYEVSTNLVALYNIYNLLGIAATIAESDIPIEQQLPYLHDIQRIEGRMERTDEGQLFNVIVDFAHAPDGMEKIFEYAKDITGDGHSIIAVFGSAGKRGTKKRRVFGGIVSHYYGGIILTEDDPRDENPREIADEIKSGINDTNNIFIADRCVAIRQAIESANVKDTIPILNKGDEIFMYREFEREP